MPECHLHPVKLQLPFQVRLNDRNEMKEIKFLDIKKCYGTTGHPVGWSLDQPKALCFKKGTPTEWHQMNSWSLAKALRPERAQRCLREILPSHILMCFLHWCVLVSAGTELTFFLVAGTVLCFGFSVRMMLITR